MDYLYILLSIIIGFVLSGVWFGLSMILNIIFTKYKLYIMNRFRAAIAAVIPTTFILIVSGRYVFNLKGIFDATSWGIVALTVLVTVLIITRKSKKSTMKGKELLLYGFDGVLMEIPQRLMMQSFMWYLLELWIVENAAYYSILSTAIVWCISIIIQNFICKVKIDADTYIELLASFIFSIGIGFVFISTELILVTMFAHFCERILSKLISNRKLVFIDEKMIQN